MMASITIKESIIDYVRDRYYFHINDLKRYFIKKGIKFEEDTLKKYLYLLKKNEVISPAGRGWYSNIQKEFELNIEPTEKIIKLNTKTIILRPSASSRISKEKNLTKIEKILVDLFMEMKKISLIDKEEYIKIVSNIILNYRINMAEMLDYADRREIKERVWHVIKEFIKSTNARI